MGKTSQERFISETIGGCLIEKKLGQGGMGEVYRAIQLSLKRAVAIKILNEILTQNERYINRFRREAQVVARINHVNIIQVYDMGEDTERKIAYFIMELVDGDDLMNLVKQNGPLPPRKAAQVVMHVAQALQTVLEENIIHRDIKPANIMLTREGVVKVADFGLAKELAQSTLMTHSGQLIGTPAFLSPEQGQGKPVDHRADIYSLGASFFYLLTARMPYEGDNVFGVVMQHINAPIPDARKFCPGLPDGIQAILAKMMAKTPSERYQNYEELITDLAGICSQAHSSRHASSSGTGSLPVTSAQLPLTPLRQLPLAKSSRRGTKAVAQTRIRPPTERQAASSPSRKKVALLVWGLILLVIGSGGYGIYNCYLKWQQRRQAATLWQQLRKKIAAYKQQPDMQIKLLREYLARYTTGSPAIQARQALAAAQARQQEVQEGYRAVTKQAQQQAQAGDYQAAITLLQKYQQQYPASTRLTTIQSKLNELQQAWAFQQLQEQCRRLESEGFARLDQVLAAMQQYLTRYPHSPYRQKVKTRLQLLQSDNVMATAEALLELSPSQFAQRVTLKKFNVTALDLWKQVQQAWHKQQFVQARKYLQKLSKQLTAHHQNLPVLSTLHKYFYLAQLKYYASQKNVPWQRLYELSKQAVKQFPRSARLRFWYQKADRENIAQSLRQDYQKAVHLQKQGKWQAALKLYQQLQSKMNPYYQQRVRQGIAQCRQLLFKHYYAKAREAYNAADAPGCLQAIYQAEKFSDTSNVFLTTIKKEVQVKVFRNYENHIRKAIEAGKLKAASRYLAELQRTYQSPPKWEAVWQKLAAQLSARQNHGVQQQTQIGTDDWRRPNKHYQDMALLKQLDQMPGLHFSGTNAQGYFEYTHTMTGIVLVLIPAGAFTMGSPVSEPGRFKDEGPVHQVYLDSYLIAKYELTQKIWQQVMGRNPSFFKSPDLPVEGVGWKDCQIFCRRTGLSLPTEAQWEKACRAGTRTAYYWGSKINSACCWYNGNASNRIHPVGQKRPNAYGLYDMAGNVWELCQDWYSAKGYQGRTQVRNPTGPAKGTGLHVLRGGSWNHGARYCRSACRSWYGPSSVGRGRDPGLRPVKNLP